MKAPTLLVSAAVGLICTAILVLFTDIELSVLRWVNCGLLASQAAKGSDYCQQRP